VNSNLRRTCSVVVCIGLSLSGCARSAFRRDAAAESNRESRLQGTWRVQINPINCQRRSAPYPFLFCSGFVRSRRHAHRSSERRSVPARPSDTRPWRLEPHAGQCLQAVWESSFSLTLLQLFPGSRSREACSGSCGHRGSRRPDDFQRLESVFDTNGNVLAVTCASGTGTRFEDVVARTTVYLRCSVW